MRVLITLVGLVLVCGSIGWSDDMKDTQRVREFKERIEFDNAGAAERSGRGVVAPWPDCLALLSLEGKGWGCESDRVSLLAGPGVVTRHCLLAKGQNKIELEIFVSSVGSGAAREHLLEIASRTMTVEIPYVLDSPGVGSRMVRHANSEVQDVIWFYYNLCGRIYVVEGAADVAPFAVQVQRMAEKHLVEQPLNQAPKIRQVSLSSKKIRVGELVRVEVGLETGTDPKNLLFQLLEEAGSLSLEEEGTTSWSFRGETPGLAEIQVRVADRRTLLSASSPVKVEVVAPEAR